MVVPLKLEHNFAVVWVDMVVRVEEEVEEVGILVEEVV